MTDDIIDTIDDLVDEQLSGGEPTTGFDFGDPQYPRCCPHCSRHWHGLPITEAVAAMYAVGRFDENYRVDTDDSRVLCRGSDFIGPMPVESTLGVQMARPWLPPYREHFVDLGPGSPQWLRQLIEHTYEWAASTIAGFSFSPFDPDWGRGGSAWRVRVGSNERRWWRLTLPAEATLHAEGDSLDLRIGDQVLHVYAENVRLIGDGDQDRRIDVLRWRAPEIGGTWEPLTAPGVVTHPSDRLRPSCGFGRALEEPYRLSEGGDR